MIGQGCQNNWDDVITSQTLDDVDEKVLNNFFDLSLESNKKPKEKPNKEALLKQLGVIEDNHLTNAGVALFSNKSPITLKMVVFASQYKITVLEQKQEKGNIFYLVDAAMAFIIRNIRWRVEFCADDWIHRKEIPEVPIDALREAIINSFVHAKYGTSIQHEINIFSNRIVITNPGSFASQFKPRDYAKKDIGSYLRNKKIDSIISLCKDVEPSGTGLKRIYSLCSSDSVDVSYENKASSFSLIFSRIDRNVVSINRKKVESSTPINGSKSERILLSLIRNDPYATNKELAIKTKKSPRTISRLISHLKSKGLIERIGSNKDGHWKVK